MNGSQNNSQCHQAKRNPVCLLLMLAFVTGLSGCATTNGQAGHQAPINQADPYENFNRKVYGFNDTVDDYVAKPVSDAYKFITPQFMQTGVFNFFNNLKTINVVLNDVLQAKFEQGGRDTGRFLMNSTLGMAGLFDVAKTVGLEQNDEDFEQTLAVWGVPQGSYLVLPLLGPITTRGVPGAVVDTAANPATYVGAPVQVISLINARANAEGSLKFIDEAALDPYVFTREAFLQWRNHLATDGKTETSSDLTDIDAELLEDDPGKKEDAKNGAVNSGTKESLTSGADISSVKDNSAPSVEANKLRILPPDSLVTDKKPTGDVLKHPGKTKMEVAVPPKN